MTIETSFLLYLMKIGSKRIFEMNCILTPPHGPLHYLMNTSGPELGVRRCSRHLILITKQYIVIVSFLCLIGNSLSPGLYEWGHVLVIHTE